MGGKVLIAVGGTGGHLLPAQQLSKMLAPDCQVMFAGYQLESTPFFKKQGACYQEISGHSLKRGFCKAVWRGFWEARRLIASFSPDVIAGFGSYHAFPVLLAAISLRKKLVLFEANCVLGKVNRVFLPFAEKIAFQFPHRCKKGVLVPLLPWIDNKRLLSCKESRKEARKHYGLDPDRKTLLIFGGSQGASFLNQIAPPALQKMNGGFQVIHLAGKEAQFVEGLYARYRISACVKSFEKEMDLAYAAADLALCRSGGGTIAELIQANLPALLIPYPYAASNHQRKNGEFVVQTVGGGRLLDQSTLTEEVLIAELRLLFNEEEAIRDQLERARLQHQNKTHLAEMIKNFTKL